jgi:hypothetical protein
MPRRMRDMRNPYGSRGGYVDRMNRRDRRMGYDRRDYRGGDYEYDSRRGDRAYSEQGMSRDGRDYEYDRQSDMDRGDYRDMRDMYQRGGSYRPVEAMGYFKGYYGSGEDYRDYGEYNDMRGRGRDYGDYNYDYGDYGESLTHEELENWKKKLMKEVDDKDRQFFETSTIEQKARQMGVEMKNYKPEELALVTVMMYTDYCKTIKKYIGSNMDIYVELAKDWLEDKDSGVKGSERLAIYYDEIVMGEDD